MNPSTDSFGSRVTLDVEGKKVVLHRLDALTKAGLGDVAALPYSIRVLLENLLRCEDGVTVTKADAAISSGQARSRLDRLVILSQSFD